MNFRFFALFLIPLVVAADSFPTGLSPGDRVPGPFSPLNVTGPSAGQKRCQVCRNGPNPVAMVFAHELSPEVTTLIKKLDEATVKNAEARMGSFVVFLSEAEGLEKQLQELAQKEKLRRIVLTIDAAGGPPKYKLGRNAEVVVILYVKYTVKANFTWKKGELNDAEIARALAEVRW